MDISTIAGIISGLFFILYSIYQNGSIREFYDFSSVLITVGGGIASILISYRISDIAKTLKVVAKAFFSKTAPPSETIKLLIELSKKARREGILSLEADQEEIKDDYIRQALQLVIDGVDPNIIKETMDLELYNLEARHQKGQSIFKTGAALFPAWGMIGTLIGLIQLLKEMDDPSKIGPAMAVALVTTFYGSILANFVCTPIANKLALISKEEINHKEMIIEGILSLQAGENPKMMEYKLITFLSPKQKAEYYENYSEQGLSANESVAREA